VLRRFEGLPHRARFVREVNGVRWINDSKATNVGATLAAVAGVREAVKGRLLLLAGGQGKGQDFGPVQALLGSQIDHMYCFGQDAEVLLALGEQTERVADLDAAPSPRRRRMPGPVTGCCWPRPAPAWINSSPSKRAAIALPNW